MVKEALRLAKLGIAVFPLAPNSKTPTKGSKGVHDATTDEAAIRRMFATAGKPFNVAIAVGMVSGGLVAVDLDRNHGATEDDLRRFPRTVTVRTRNGYHLYFKVNRACKKGALFGGKSDGDNTAAAYLRSDGQYFVAPPSVVTWDETRKTHLAPWEYSYHQDAGGELSFFDCELAYLPEEFYRDSRAITCHVGQVEKSPATNTERQLAGQSQDAIGNAGSSSQATQGSGDSTYEPGLRHDCFVRTAVSMRKRGKASAAIRRALLERNSNDFTIPKENAEEEIDKILSWVEKKIKPLVIHEVNQTRERYKQYLLPLGHRDENYYYTTSDNKMIVRLSRASHTSNNLLDLMPYAYWAECFPKPNKDGTAGINWLMAASDMMEACRDTGIYSDQNVRGVGCWDDGGRLVYHTGDKLIVNDTTTELNGVEGSQYLYALRPSVVKASTSVAPLTVSECGVLIDACQSLAWKNPQSAKLLAGGIAIARLCGALPWRPHIWLTSTKGCGKSAIMSHLIRSALSGDSAIFIQGETTSAGIRQCLESDSKPVIFDESETNNQRSSTRMQHVVELARQASFENDGKILKGTADGSGHSYKITSMFILASTRVNLVEDADISRFSVLHLDKPDGRKWPQVKQKLTKITPEFGERLHIRMMGQWSNLKFNIEQLENAIAEIHDRRAGQQYGALLAGWWSLTSDCRLSLDQATLIARELVLDQAQISDGDADEHECVSHMLSHRVVYSVGDVRFEETLGSLVNKSVTDRDSLNPILWLHGMALSEDCRTIALGSKNPYLRSIFRDTKWGEQYDQALLRLDDARRQKVRMGPNRSWCIALPVENLFK